MAEYGLKEKTVKGVVWSGIDNVVQFCVTFIVSIVLARLLSPEDYGLIGIVGIFTAICTVIINGGFSTALIRKKDATDDDYNTAFFLNLALSLLLYAVVFLCSPLIADFFHHDELVLLTQVSSFALVVGAPALVQQTRLTKHIDFKTQAIITLAASVCSGAIGIVMALMGFGVWALVAQSLSRQTLTTVLLLFYNKWIPQFRFSSASFYELFSFGWKIALSGLFNSVWKELNQVVVGKFYSPTTLGQFTRAKQFSSLFSSNLTTVIQRVTFPVLSDIQDERVRLLTAYRRIIKVTMFVTATGMFFLGAISEPLLYCLIGPKWHEAAVYLPLICISGSLYPLYAINLNMLQVQGRSDLFLGLEVVKKIIGLAPLVACFFWGVLSMLYVSLVIGIIAFFLNSYFSGRLIGYSSWMQVKDVAPSYGVATIVALSVYFLKHLPITFWIVLPVQLLTGFLILFFSCQITRPEGYIELKGIATPFLKKMRNKT